MVSVEYNNLALDANALSDLLEAGSFLTPHLPEWIWTVHRTLCTMKMWTGSEQWRTAAHSICSWAGARAAVCGPSLRLSCITVALDYLLIPVDDRHVTTKRTETPQQYVWLFLGGWFPWRPGKRSENRNSLRLDGPGIDSRGRRDFPYPSTSAQKPTQPPVQWVPGLFRR